LAFLSAEDDRLADVRRILRLFDEGLQGVQVDVDAHARTTFRKSMTLSRLRLPFLSDLKMTQK
jgi:hypothetical protein